MRSQVNINEQTVFIIALLKKQLSPDWSPERKPWTTFYFTVSRHFHTFKDVAVAIGKAIPELLKVSTEPKSLPVPTWDKSQKGVRVEDDSRQAGEQAKIEQFTPFWPDRSTNRAVAKHAEEIPGGPWFKTEYHEKQMIEDLKWIVEQWKEKGEMPEYEL